MRKVIPVLVLIALTGCASKMDVIKLNGFEGGAARSGDVTVYLDKDSVKRPYQEVALIEANDRGYEFADSRMIQEIQQKAAGMGADAIILRQKQTNNAGGVIVGSMWVNAAEKHLSAVAIVYRDEEPRKPASRN